MKPVIAIFMLLLASPSFALDKKPNDEISTQKENTATSNLEISNLEVSKFEKNFWGYPIKSGNAI